MNKQEAIEEVTELFGDSIQAKAFRNIIRKLHEQQKVVIPKFVAEWIEHCKDRGSTLYFAFTPSRMSRELNEWMALGKNDDIFARAWLDGYEIEQEKLYTVEIPNPNIPVQYHSRLAKNYKGKVVLEVQDWLNIADAYKLTESEIKEDFEWAWDEGFYEPVEVE